VARKRAQFDWTQEDGFADRVERPNRKELKAEMRELERLAVSLASMPAAERRRLPLTEHVLGELGELAKLTKGPARKRQRLLVTTLLRESDREALDQALDGGGPEQERLWALERWRERLIAEGNPAIQEFLDEHPGGDRQQLRRLAGLAAGEGDAASRARKKLFAVLKAAG
jgi:ribosome-associated protein